jgi:hypothetical protein
MAEIRDELVLDIDRALASVRELERALDRALSTVVVDVDVKGTAEVTRLDTALDETTTSAKATDRAIDTIGSTTRRSAREAEAAAGRFSGSMDKLRGRIIAAGAAIAAAFGVRAIVGFANDAIQAFSDLNESTSKAQVVFGQFAGEVQNFAKTAPQALGLSTAAATEMTATFGNLLLTVGLTQQSAADMSQKIVQLGADLASFNNIDVQDALDKLRAGLAGEAEPLRALGVFLSEAAVAAKAVELGLAASTGEVDQAAKVQARYALIMEQTTTAQGDFARTADGIANSSRTLQGEFENLKAAIGEQLAPAFKSLLDNMPLLLDQVERLGPAFGAAATGIADATPHVLRFFGAIATGFAATELGGGNFALTLAISNMIKQLEEGVDPATAMANAMAFLARRRPGLGIFTDEVEKLAQVSGASPAQIKAAAQAVQGLGANAGVGTRDVAALNFEIEKTNEELRDNQFTAAAQQGAAYLDFLNDAGRGQQGLADSVADSDAAFAIVVAAADEAGLSLQDFAATASTAAPEVQAALAQLTPADLAAGDFQSQLAGLARDLRTTVVSIADSIDIFQGAVDDSGVSAEEMTQNILDATTQLADFDANLAILAARGFTALAQALRDKGPAASAAAQDFVDNIDLAGKADAALSGATSAVSESARTAVTTALANADIEDLSSEAFAGIAAGIADPSLRAAIATELSKLLAVMAEFGVNAGLAFARGIRSPAVLDAVGDAGATLASRAEAGTSSQAQITSPSKVFIHLGEQVGIGFAQGIENTMPNIALDIPAVPAFAPPGGMAAGPAAISVSNVINNPVTRDLDAEIVRLTQTTGQVASLLAGRII